MEGGKKGHSEPPTTLTLIYLPHQVRNDWLDLRVPIWDQDIQFLPESQKLVTCTGYHQVTPHPTPYGFLG